MKRYLLFRGIHYYPQGGFGDYRGSFDTIKECKDIIGELDKFTYDDWAHIVDSYEDCMVWQTIDKEWAKI